MGNNSTSGMDHSLSSGPAGPPNPADTQARRWWTLAAAALLLRFFIMPSGGFPTDIGTFKAWAAALAERGPGAFYGGGFADYLPGYLYILWLIGESNQVLKFNEVAYLFVLKLPSALADLTAGWLIFALVRGIEPRLALALSASYLFNPGIVFNSAYWGQVDAVGTLLALAGVAVMGMSSSRMAAQGTGLPDHTRSLEAPAAEAPPREVSLALAVALLTAGVLVKPQTAPVALAVGLFLLRTLAWPVAGRRRWDLVFVAAAAGVATLMVLLAPFRLNPVRLAILLGTSMNVYPYGSVVAFNLWGAVQGFWKSDLVRWLGIPLNVIGTAASLAALAVAGRWAWRHPTRQGMIMAAAVMLLVTFVLPTRIHERYLQTAIAFFALAAAYDRRMGWLYAGLSALFALNLLYAYTRPYLQTFLLPGWLEMTVFSGVGTRVLSALGALCLPVAFYVLFTQARRR